MADKKATYTPMPQVSPELRQRYEPVVGVLAGTTTVAGAARALGFSRNHFQTIMHRSLEAMIGALAPKAAGRPATPARERELSRKPDPAKVASFQGCRKCERETPEGS